MTSDFDELIKALIKFLNTEKLYQGLLENDSKIDLEELQDRELNPKKYLYSERALYLSKDVSTFRTEKKTLMEALNQYIDSRIEEKIKNR